jgi:eukaryotic-like serine/threonine-protein kinase
MRLPAPLPESVDSPRDTAPRPHPPVRRRRRIGVRPLALFLLAGALIAADEWPQFRGTPELTGVAAAPLASNLTLQWTWDAGEPIESSAAISGNTVFVGTQAAELVALDLQTGKLRWRHKVKDGIGESSPSVFEGIVYIGDLSGMFHAVNAADGKPLWTFLTEAEIRSSPVVTGDRVLIGSYDGNLYCLARRTGKLLWKFNTPSYVHGTPLIVSGVAYIAGCDETFHGIRIADGQEVVEFPSGGYTGASPALSGALAIYGTFAEQVVAVDPRTKRTVWTYDPPSPFPFYSSAAVAGERLVLGGRDKLVHCLNVKTGKPLWTFATRGRVDSSPAVAGSTVYIGSNDKKLYALSLDSGRKMWEFETGGAVTASPAIAAGRLAIGSQDGRVYCFK